MQWLCGKLDEALCVIFSFCVLFADETTAQAFVHDSLHAAGRNSDTRGLHSPLAKGSAIAWMYIYMLTPQARGAVIRVAVPGYTSTATVAHEIFFCSSETHGAQGKV